MIENYDQDSDNLWRKVTALPIPANDSEPEKIITLFGDLEQKNESYATQDQNPGICLTIDLLQENTKAILEDLPSNSFPSLLPVISESRQLGAIATDNVLYDNYADHADDSTRGVIAYWPMNGKNGNEISDLAGNYKGTLIGNAKLEIVNDFPIIGSRKVLQLDDNGDYVEFADENANFGQFGTRNFSIGLWFRTTESSGTLMLGDGAKSNYWRIILKDGFARFGFNAGDFSGNPGSSSPATVNDGNWHHLTAIRDDGRSGKLYLDGVLVDEFRYGGDRTEIGGVSKVFIGKNQNTDYFHGQIAEVTIWDVVISAEQISNASIPFTPLITENISGSHVSVTGIDNQPGWFTFDNGDEAFLAFPQQANGFQQIDDSLKTVTQDGEITLSYNGSDISNLEQLKFSFSRLSTSTIRQLSQKMLVGGLDNLLTLDSQLTPELNFARFSPSDFVNSPHNSQLDFDGPLGIYFWEIFFHIPFLVANTLNSNQRFEEAQKWYHYIFNPTNPTELDREAESNLDRFWRFLPFRGNTLQKLEGILSNDAAIDAYNNNPFDPHAIARLRIGAYEKAIVMKYIDNLLDWGDLLFAQDNRESIKIALDMAVAAQSAYQYEINNNDTFINFAYWDSLKQGLLAGESLMLSLNQMEKAYMEGNSRSFEIEKTISLRQLNLLAFQQLKETGTCEFELNEQLFDLDFPGHYARQIKTIAVSIPAVVSPYQNISATLTQTSNKTLLKPNADAVKFLLGETEEIPDASTLRNNWRSNQKIAISKADMDNGLFALNFFADTRYFPFEGTGAVSTWELSLPKQTNHIDFDTISDVIITLSYTALDGGDAFRKTVTNSASLKSSSEAYYFNLKQAFPNEWHTFMNPETEANSQELSFQISEEIIPPQIEDTKLTGIIFKLDAPNASSPLKFATIKIEENEIVDENSIDETVAKNWFGDWAIDFDLNEVPNHLKKDGFLNPEIVKNIELILIYEGQILSG